MRWLIGAALAIVAVLGVVYWYFLDARAPASAPGVFDIAAYRALTAQDLEGLPTEARVEFVGTDEAPLFAIEAGAGMGRVQMAYTAFELVSPSGVTIIDAAIDQQTSQEMAQGDAARFDAESYSRVLDAVTRAEHVLITHEHLDHVMGIARHPNAAAIAPHLQLTAPQIAALPRHAPAAGLDPALQNLAPFALDAPTRIAPGIVAAPMPGHSPGSIVIYARTQGGREYLFIGDIVWAMRNIDNLRTRPRILQLLMFDPNEDREAVLAQVRALHDLRAAEPALVIVPAHDGAYLRGLVERGALAEGFETPPQPAPDPAPEE
ncbi:MAG: MBL fold metallo-hydrolase [Hyphomonadaceae bacterium]